MISITARSVLTLLLVSFWLTPVFAQSPGLFESVHRNSLALRVRLTTKPSATSVEAAQEPFDVELRVAKAKLKTARDKEVFAAYEKVSEHVRMLVFEWKLVHESESSLAALEGMDRETARLAANVKALQKMADKINATISAIDAAEELYLKKPPVRKKPAGE